MSAYGAQSMVAPLRRVLVRAPDASFGDADPVRWHYTARPDLARARAEHAALIALLRAEGAEVLLHDTPLPDHADAIFVHDPVLVTDRGTIVLRMGKPVRRGEEDALAAALERHGVPVLARLTGDARAEGGDCLWLAPDLLAVGLGFRTNAEGLGQIAAALGPAVRVVPVPLPYDQGPEACLHLMSLISLLADDLAIVHRPLLPVPFWELLQARGVRGVDVPEAEYARMGTNVLALAPRRCLMLEGNPGTRARLEAAGCTVLEYRGEELSRKAEGGPTCLTRPVRRG